MLRSYRNTLLLSAILLPAGTVVANAQAFLPGNLVVSQSTFVPSVGEAAALKPGSDIIVAGTVSATATGKATAADTNLTVFQNSKADGNFGISAPLSLIQVNPATGAQVGATLTLPTSQIVTSFPSKSEGSLSLTPDGSAVVVAGYAVQDGRNPVGALELSNASTGAANGNDAGSGNSNGFVNRTVAQVSSAGVTSTTTFNAYSGNNPRAALLNNGNYYLVGNGNSGNTGVELLTPGNSAAAPTGSNQANNSTQIGTYSITQNGYAADKAIKDNNFRGETVYNNTLYVTKGSGGNGINTVYQVGATGALANGAALTANAPISILPGFPTSLAKGTGAPSNTPFGLFFANSTTLYVSDEGTGGTTDSGATVANGGTNTQAGLEKWTFNGTTWVLDYVLQAGLVGVTQTYTAATGDGLIGTINEEGLRNIYGVVNGNSVSIFGITATNDNITGNDNGDDPNQLVSITDVLSATTLPAGEAFTTLIQATPGTVLRGVSAVPLATTVPEPASLALLGMGLAGLASLRRRRG